MTVNSIVPSSGYAGIGDVINLTMTSSEFVTLFNCSLNTYPVPGGKTSYSVIGNVHKLGIVVSVNDYSGSVVLSCAVSDVAGNKVNIY